MLRYGTPRGRRPLYHPGMLLVKLRPTAAPALARMVARGMAVARAPGLSALSAIERAGLVRRLVSLARPTEERALARAERSMLAHFAAARPSRPRADANADVHLVELERNVDVAAVQVTLGNDAHVEAVSRVPVRYLCLPARRRTARRSPAATPPPAWALWNLRRICWADARARAGFKEASRIRVAVLDTGVDPRHPDLRKPSGYVFEHPDLREASSDRDLVGHGTHVAGTIAARINNAVGINGICDCTLSVWKIFTDEPQYDADGDWFTYFVDPVMYQRALADCIEGGVDVVNLSIGGPGRPDFQERALFRGLIEGGTTVVAAMGNERAYGSPTSYPAAIPGVIAVGATSLDDSIADFSNRGNHVTLSAPGRAIWSTLPTYRGQDGFAAAPGPGGEPVQGKALHRKRHYDAWDGTSMATPHVTAAAALLLTKKGKVKPAAVRAALAKSADKVPGMNGRSFDSDFGSGRLNLRRLLG